jgi:hypothetical protein
MAAAKTAARDTIAEIALRVRMRLNSRRVRRLIGVAPGAGDDLGPAVVGEDVQVTNHLRRSATNLRLNSVQPLVRRPTTRRSQKINMPREMRPYSAPATHQRAALADYQSGYQLAVTTIGLGGCERARGDPSVITRFEMTSPGPK